MVTSCRVSAASQIRLSTGISMRVHSAGDGLPAVFLHGFPGLAQCWRRQLAELSDSYRVIAPDMRGYGGTDAPRSWRHYGLEQHLIPDVLALLDALNIDRAHLVGHDLGGLVAWQLAQSHPERVRSLAALNCPHPAVFLRALRDDRRQRNRSVYMLLAQLPWYPERKIARNAERYITRLMRERAVKPERFSDDELRPYIDQARAGVHGGLNYYRALLRMRPRTHRRIDVPALLLWGAQDHVLGAELAQASRYTSHVSDLAIDVIDGAAHWVQIDASERVNQRLRDHFRRAEQPRGR